MAHAPAFRLRRLPGEALLDTVKQTWARYWRHRAAFAAATMLRSLDDRTLKDIGLDRSEIESVVYGGREDGRSTACNASRSAERRIGMCL